MFTISKTYLTRQGEFLEIFFSISNYKNIEPNKKISQYNTCFLWVEVKDNNNKKNTKSLMSKKELQI
jgi:hypothetical protein